MCIRDRYYFGSNGKKYTPEDSSEGGDYRVARIDGEYFCFGADGRMMTGWVYLEGDPDSAPSDSIEDWSYFAEEGIRNVTLGSAVQGWLSLEPPEILQNNVDEPVVWYYFNKDGTPKTGPDVYKRQPLHSGMLPSVSSYKEENIR